MLRKRKTGQFYRNGRWTERRELADDFPDVASAVMTGLREQPDEMELVMQAEEQPSKWDLRFRLDQFVGAQS